MKQILLSVSLLIGATVNAQDCNDLFISEYVEGWSNNKALEIYNPTDQAIDLGGYVLQRFSNGSNTADQQATVQLTGTIDAYSTYVAVLDKRDPDGQGQEAPIWDELQDKADGFYCPDYNISKAMYFNGNDALVLAKGNISDLGNLTLVDVFGRVGQDPDDEGGTDYDGWTSDYPHVGEGTVVTTDHSMIRKNTILKGETNLQISFFDPLAQWDSLPPVIIDPNTGNLVGNWSTLGSHECECDPSSSVNEVKKTTTVIYPNPSVNGDFNLKIDTPIASLIVLDALGQEVLNRTNLDSVTTLSIGSKTGVYFVNILTTDGSFVTRRIIVK